MEVGLKADPRLGILACDSTSGLTAKMTSQLHQGLSRLRCLLRRPFPLESVDSTDQQPASEPEVQTA